MTVVFRADASDRIGTGHVMRCLNLAGALQAHGVQSRFICRAHTGHLIDALRAQSFPVTALPAPSVRTSGDEDYAAWLGVPLAEDAEQTIHALGEDVTEWLVVDHYALDRGWEEQLRPHVGRVLVIDDLANRTHDCDVLLDQNYSDEGERRRRGLVPASCRLLLGPHYALLAPDYARYREAQPTRDGNVRRVLVYFGGVDPSNVTGQALAALSAPAFSHLAVDLVIGTNHPHRASLQARAAGRPATHVHGTRPHLADLMAAADLAIGAGGTTTWERMCLGLPSLVVSIAENQRSANEALAAAGLIQYLGDASSVDAARIGAALTTIIGAPDVLVRLSARGRLLVDGCGATRVADVLLGHAADDRMHTRLALHEADAVPEGFDTFRFAWIDRCDAADVLALRNQPHVTAQMRSRDVITAADHARFLEAYPRLDRYDFMLVDTRTSRPVGAFYITCLESSPEIGKYIGDPEYLGKGIAHRAMQRLLEFCRSQTGLHHLKSMTRRDNLRNIALNAKLGFDPTGTDGAYIVMTKEL